MSIVAFLVTSKVGRFIVALVITLLMVGLIVWRVFAEGKRSAKIDQNLSNLAALQNVIKTKVATNNEIHSLSNADRRERLRQWVSDTKSGG